MEGDKWTEMTSCKDALHRCIFSANVGYETLRRKRGYHYRNVLNTMKNKTKTLSNKTRTQVALIHLMDTPECGIMSSATFGSDDSVLETLWKRNCLGRGNRSYYQ